MTVYQNKIYDEERALYGVHGALVEGCRFEGPADGESALKEAGNLTVRDCDFMLRYPLWHVSDSTVENCRMSDTCRAALWYDKNLILNNCVLNGIKAMRECDNTLITDSSANSAEFGWFCRGLTMKNCSLVSEYPFMKTSDLTLENFKMKGKYSFQYVENAVIRDAELDTKDAFWHGKNITVYDSVIKGEYLAWYSENLKLIRCKIIGTQPLCYAKGLVLENCEMVDCDLSFEKSDVVATVRGSILSVKNPLGGSITADSIGEIIFDEHAAASACKITQRG